MLVEFRAKKEFGKVMARIPIEKITVGSVVQKVNVSLDGTTEVIQYADCYGHIVKFTRVNGQLAMMVQWDSRSDVEAILPRNLVLL